MALTDKQQLFVEEYLLDMNLRQACKRAGFSSNYSQIINQPEVRAAIQARLAERSRRLVVDQDRVLMEIARLAFNDPRRVFNADGCLLPVQEWPEEVAAAVSSIKVNEIKAADGSVLGETKEIKFWDKGRQLELAARHLGMLNDKLEISTPVAQMIKAARERIRNS